MKYFEAYRFVFRNKKWLTNWAVCTVATLIPIAGAMVVLGYHFDIIESLHLRRKESYPDFDFNRLGKYLLRGAWPFLVSLVVALPLGLIFAVLYVIFVIGLMTTVAQKGDETAVAVWVGIGIVFLLFFLLLNLAAYLVVLPLMLRSGLMQDFSAAFSWTFVREFIRLVWKEMLLTELFLMVTGIPLVLLGLLCLYFGLFPVAALLQFVRAYFICELYELYLQRGGTPVPLAVQSATESSDSYEEN